MMTTFVPLVVVTAAVAATAWWLRTRSGVAHSTHVRFGVAELLALGLHPGVPAIVLFTAPGCATCVPARRVIDDIAGRHVVPVAAIDVADHHDLARDKHVLRAPTTFVLDSRGLAVARFVGVPRDTELAGLLPEDQAVA